MKIKAFSLSIIILVVMFGGITLTSALNLWQTTTTKQAATFKEGEFSGTANPADIRGSFTLNDISKQFEVPLEDLGQAFAGKDKSLYAAFKAKDVEAMYTAAAAEGKEVGTGSIRLFVALYKGLPYEITEESYLPQPAVDILKAKAKLTAEQLTYLDSHGVPAP